MSTYETPEYHPAFEEYTETIFELAEDDVDVIQARIAERLQVSRPAVSEMIRRMQAADLVIVDVHGQISLTSGGHELATAVVRRHRLAERFLTDILQLSWADAHHEAGKWEHVISPVVETALVRHLGDPDTCPHGNPIPGSSYQRPDGAMTLSLVEGGQGFRVERIPEELEFQEGQLEYLETAGLLPGRTGQVLTAAPDGTVTVMVDDTPVGLSSFAAERILVTAV